MIKLFFAIIFLAELIIAWAVISYILRLDRFAVEFNEKLKLKACYFKPFFNDLRLAFIELNNGVIQLKSLVEKKREEYFINFVKNLLTYSLIFLLRGRYKKAFVSYLVAKEIYDGCLEA